MPSGVDTDKHRLKLFTCLPVFLLVFLCVFASFAFAAAAPQPASTQDVMSDVIIGMTFKTFARAFLLAVDLEQIKRNAINKITDMDEGKFKRKYAKIRDVIKEYPDIMSRYGFSANLDKAQVIKKIKSLNKDKANEILNGIPDYTIGKQFRMYLSERGAGVSNTNMAGQINKFLNKMKGTAQNQWR